MFIDKKYHSIPVRVVKNKRQNAKPVKGDETTVAKLAELEKYYEIVTNG
ncbi:42691_t:CDS:2, partial [Gigaspora margarita]